MMLTWVEALMLAVAAVMGAEPVEVEVVVEPEEAVVERCRSYGYGQDVTCGGLFIGPPDGGIPTIYVSSLHTSSLPHELCHAVQVGRGDALWPGDVRGIATERLQNDAREQECKRVAEAIITAPRG